jgi:chromosome segregation ATPase
MATFAGVGLVTLASIILNIYLFSSSRLTTKTLTDKNVSLKQTKTGLDEKLTKYKSAGSQVAKLNNKLEQIKKDCEAKENEAENLRVLNEKLEEQNEKLKEKLPKGFEIGDADSLPEFDALEAEKEKKENELGEKQAKLDECNNAITTLEKAQKSLLEEKAEKEEVAKKGGTPGRKGSSAEEGNKLKKSIEKQEKKILDLQKEMKDAEKQLAEVRAIRGEITDLKAKVKQATTRKAKLESGA